MKLAIIGAFLAVLSACGGSGVATTPSDGFELLGPFRHENLEVYLVRRPGVPDAPAGHLTLEEGLQAGTVRVSETSADGDVNELEVDNTGDRPVYLQAGDTVKGGKQDRTIAVDAVLPPKSGKTKIDAFCVEPGRWALRSPARGGAAPLSGATFSLAEIPLASKEQKLAVRNSGKQEEVWAAGRATNAALARNASSSVVQDSFVLAVEDPKVKEQLDRTVAALTGAPASTASVVGAVFLVNGRPSTAELYATSGLFRKLWPKLLRGAAAEAFATKGEPAAAPAAGPAEVRALLAGPSGGEELSRSLPAGVTSKSRDGKESACFDTVEGGTLLRRQVIAK